MKELSIEEKAKRYDEAYKKVAIRFGSNVADEIFSVFRESEDERIRKNCIHFLELQKTHHAATFEIEECIDWIEKQGEQSDANKEYWRGYNEGKQCILDKYAEIEKQGEQKLTPIFRIGDTIMAKDGTYIEKEPFHIDKIEDDCYWDGENTILVCNQDEFEIFEQKLASEVKPKFHKGDWIITNKNHIWYVDETPETTSYLYRLINQYGKVEVAEFEVVDKKARLWTIQDAKDGDVLVASDGSIFLFKGTIDWGCKHYVALTTDGAVKFNEGLKHFWETSTAVHPATKEQRDTLMKAMADADYEWDAEKKELKKIEQNHAWSKKDEVFFKTVLWHLSYSISNGKSTDIHCDTTDWFKSLKDRVQLQLKQGEQKLAWSEEDERIYKVVLELIDSYSKGTIGGCIIPPNIGRYLKWFKALKDRVQSQLKQGEQKPAWSEEDERKLRILIAMCDETKGDSVTYSTMYREMEELKTWLKSLKERYTWKPSDEQMEALDRAQAELCSTEYNKPICDLIDSLNKLREE